MEERDDLTFLIPTNVRQGFDIFGCGIRELLPCALFILLGLLILINAVGKLKLACIPIGATGIFLGMPTGGEPLFNPFERLLKRLISQKTYLYGRSK